MITTPVSLLRCVPLAAAIVLAPSGAHPQSAPASPARAAVPSSLPTVMQPAEGQVVTGDLEIAVQAQAGVAARKYTVEAAYWDPGASRWVYPGTMGEDFAGGTSATVRLAGQLRSRYSRTAARWRIHVRTVDPPGSWSPWREFTWQEAPPAAKPAATASAPPADTGAQTAAAPVTPPALAAAAEYDKLIASAKQQIALLRLKIEGLQRQIASLKADSVNTEKLLADASGPGVAPAKYQALKAHLDRNDKAIDGLLYQIKQCKADIKKLEKTVADMEKDKAKALSG